ncbi:MAG: putative quinol monooxygenase [Thermodesulfobacteriota bacterium]
MLILIAKFRTKSECRDQMIALAKDAIGPSRSEEGCIIYEFLQDPFSPDSFTFYEKWRSREDLDLHFEEPHFKEFAQKSPELIEGSPSLLSFEVASENKIA